MVFKRAGCLDLFIEVFRDFTRSMPLISALVVVILVAFQAHVVGAFRGVQIRYWRPSCIDYLGVVWFEFFGKELA